LQKESLEELVEEIKREVERKIEERIQLITEKISEEVDKAVKEALNKEASRAAVIGIYIPKEEIRDLSKPERIAFTKLLEKVREGVARSIGEVKSEAEEEIILSINEEKGEKAMHALANSHRIKILKLLFKEEKNFSKLAEATSLKPSSLTHHLEVLIENKLVRKGREGYSLTPRGADMLRLLAIVVGGEETE